MIALSLVVVLACLPAPPENETIVSANKRFTLAVDVKTRTISLSERGALKWKIDTSPDASREYFVGDDGSWAAIVNGTINRDDAPVVTLLDASGKPRLITLRELTITEEERQWFLISGCGTHWLDHTELRDGLLIFHVRQSGNLPPIYKQTLITVSLDPRTGVATHGAPVARPTVAELIADKSPQAFGLLRAKARLSTHENEPALCEFFGRFLPGDDVQKRRAAITALADAKCVTELNALGGPRNDESDLEILEVLELREPAKALEFARKVREHPNQLMRTRAVIFVIKNAPADRLETARIASNDPAVFDSALYELGNVPKSPELFEVFLKATQQTDRAKWLVMDQLLVEETARTRFFEAFTKGELTKWAGSEVIGAAMLEVRGDPVLARTHYARGATALLAAKPKTVFWAERELWCEATMRLAQLTNDRKEALKLAQSVVDDAKIEGVEISAPSPSRYAVATRTNRRTARAVAKALIDLKP